LFQDANMGPYYVILWPWVRINDGDLWIRLLSTLGVVATVWAIWAIVRRWSGSGVAAVAVAVYALTPFVLSWSMQARGYALAMALITWSVYFADRIRVGEGRWSGALFGVFVGLSIAMQLTTAFVFVGIVATVLALAPTRQTARSLVMAGFTAVIAFSPFAIAVALNTDQADWIPALTMRLFTQEFFLASSGPIWAVFIASGWVCLLAAAWRVQGLRPYLVPIAGVVMGIAGLVVISLFLRPMFIGRYLIGCLPLAVIAAAGGWSVLWTRWRLPSAIAIVGVSVLLIGASIDRTRPPPEDYRGAAADVTERLRPVDGIVAVSNYPITGLVRYLPEGIETQRFIAPSPERQTWSIRNAEGATVQPERIWLVIRDAPPPGLRDWLFTNYPIVVSEQWYGQLILQLRASAA
jgi:mannosyltransferase